MSWCNKIMHLVQCKFAFFACRERGNAWKGQIQFQYTFSLHDDAHTCLPTTILNLTALMALHYQPSKATSGRVTNPILFCQLLTIKEHCRKFRFLKKNTIKAYISCSWQSALITTLHNVSLNLYSSMRNVPGKVDYLERCRVSLKSLSRVQDRRNKRKEHTPKWVRSEELS